MLTTYDPIEAARRALDDLTDALADLDEAALDATERAAAYRAAQDDYTDAKNTATLFAWGGANIEADMGRKPLAGERDARIEETVLRKTADARAALRDAQAAHEAAQFDLERARERVRAARLAGATHGAIVGALHGGRHAGE